MGNHEQTRCKILTLGESLLRLSPVVGERIVQAQTFQAIYGGAEANVAVNLAQLGHEVQYATKLPNHVLGDAVLRHLTAHQVDTTAVLRGEGRLGSYYFEPGVNLRGGQVLYDRAHSTMAEMTQIEWDLDRLFEGVGLFHTSGITLALSPFWQQAGIQLISEARRRGITISFDMNYRATLWSYPQARAVYQQVLPMIDYLSATRRDAVQFMGLSLLGTEREGTQIEQVRAMSAHYPNLQVIYGTNRTVHTATEFTLTGFVYETTTDRLEMGPTYHVAQVIDRIGAGDAYAATILSGLWRNDSLVETVALATAAAALKHTVFGDCNQFTRLQLLDFVQNNQHMQR